jgi:hypothetical protein
MVAIRPEAIVGQLMFLCLGFLDADNIGILLGQPVEKALAGRGTNAVCVDRYNAKQLIPLPYLYFVADRLQKCCFVWHT